MKRPAVVDKNRPMAIPSKFNGRTVAGYESCAVDYAASTAPPSNGSDPRALGELLKVVDRGSRLLEIGSGPGWDADWLEARGLQVRRTDAAEAFVNLQNGRGKFAERLDVLNDELGGPYDAIVSLYVLQHIDRDALPLVLNKLSQALRRGGSLLFSIREGVGETVEQGTSGATYYIALWQRAELVAELEPLGFGLRWSESTEDTEGKWLTALFVKRPHQTDSVG